MENIEKEEFETENTKVGFWKILFTFLSMIFIVGILGLYWLTPLRQLEFTAQEINHDFNIEGMNQSLQFYEKMRYSSSEISYEISDCELGRKNEMQEAFRILSNLTLINFFEAKDLDDAEISVTCEDNIRISDSALFIAGEGGPTEIIKTKNFNVIKKGHILLLKRSNCQKPNIAIHELLHTLGFEHSSNPGNIMYNISKCNQEIGNDIIQTINTLYSYPSYQDLTLQNISATSEGRYLDINITIINNGLKKSEKTEIGIYTDDELVKNFDLESLEIGYGKTISFKNIWLKQRDFSEIKVEMLSNQPELNLEDNKIKLKIKEKEI